MKKLKLKLEGMKEMLTKEQMKKINGGYNCTYDFDCGVYGHCIGGNCDNSNGGGTSCQENNGGCQPDRICIMNGSTTECI